MATLLYLRVCDALRYFSRCDKHNVGIPEIIDDVVEQVNVDMSVDDVNYVNHNVEDVEAGVNMEDDIVVVNVEDEEVGVNVEDDIVGVNVEDNEAGANMEDDETKIDPSCEENGEDGDEIQIDPNVGLDVSVNWTTVLPNE